ncbi:MAG: triose-phosphate isomerase, partial [Caldilineaceae bacterium]|nr:triose-phosphate isomerase [Caldilineaceae bacterium]
MMAGNWKMNKTIDEAVALATAIHDSVGDVVSVDRVVCPTYVCLPAVRAALSGSSVAVGAQNVHWEANGAYTGEISTGMLEGLVDYVIIGHSERREYFAETDETVNKKIHAALAAGLKPIVCVGESLEQNQAGETASFVSGQVRGALVGLSAAQVADLIIAYEPIWAIGTGLAATAEQAQDICGDVVRAAVADLYDADVAAQTRVLYGGSTKPGNI